jgi:hypothetical protein
MWVWQYKLENVSILSKKCHDKITTMYHGLQMKRGALMWRIQSKVACTNLGVTVNNYSLRQNESPKSIMSCHVLLQQILANLNFLKWFQTCKMSLIIYDKNKLIRNIQVCIMWSSVSNVPSYVLKNKGNSGNFCVLPRQGLPTSVWDVAKM